LLCQAISACGQTGWTCPSIAITNPPSDGRNLDTKYKRSFTMAEILLAVQRLRPTTLGADRVHNAFLKSLSNEQLSELLLIFNQSYCTGIFLSAWKKGVILPILKPGKDPSQPT
jgi:hypothetical protein